MQSRWGGRLCRSCMKARCARADCQCSCKSFAESSAQAPGALREPGGRAPRLRGEGLETGCQLAHTCPMTDATNRKPDYERDLRRAGVRITRQRKVLLEILAEAGDHPDAMEIFRRASTI